MWVQRQHPETARCSRLLTSPVAQVLSYRASMVQGRQLLTAHAPVIRHFVVAPSLTLATVIHILAFPLKPRHLRASAVCFNAALVEPRN